MADARTMTSHSHLLNFEPHECEYLFHPGKKINNITERLYPDPSPLLPRAPLCVRGLSRGTEGPAGAGAFSTLDLDSDWAPGEVGWTGARPPRSPPSLSTVLFSPSFPTLRPISAL